MPDSMNRNDMAERVFLALCLYREARGEPQLAKVAVALSVLNRVRRPSWWGSDVLGVLFKKWQYSSFTDPHDRQLTVWPQRDDQAWQECLDVAISVLEGFWDRVNPAPCADSYHDVSIASPAWARREMFVTRIGRLKFYNVDLDYEAVKGEAADG